MYCTPLQAICQSTVVYGGEQWVVVDPPSVHCPPGDNVCPRHAPPLLLSPLHLHANAKAKALAGGLVMVMGIRLAGNFLVIFTL